jgi:hypothetical protein
VAQAGLGGNQKVITKLPDNVAARLGLEGEDDDSDGETGKKRKTRLEHQHQLSGQFGLSNIRVYSRKILD